VKKNVKNQPNLAQVKEKQIIFFIFFLLSLLNSFVGGRRLGDAMTKHTLSQTEIFLSTYTGKRLLLVEGYLYFCVSFHLFM